MARASIDSPATRRGFIEERRSRNVGRFSRILPRHLYSRYSLALSCRSPVTTYPYLSCVPVHPLRSPSFQEGHFSRFSSGELPFWHLGSRRRRRRRLRVRFSVARTSLDSRRLYFLTRRISSYFRRERAHASKRVWGKTNSRLSRPTDHSTETPNFFSF